MVRDLMSAVLPAGGQLRARRNAWAAMSEGAQRARSRADADAAMNAATDRYAVGGAQSAL